MNIDDVDLAIADWLHDTARADRTPDVAELLRAVDAIPQRRRFAAVRAPFLGAGERPPLVRPGTALVALALLVLLAWATAVLVAGAHRPVPFTPLTYVDVPDASGALVIGAAAHGFWVGGDHAAIRLDGSGGQVHRIPAPVAASDWTGIVEGDGRLWLADYAAGAVYALDPTTGDTTARITLPSARGDAPHPWSPTWAAGLWVLGSPDGGDLYRINPATMTVDRHVSGAHGLLADGESVWYVRLGGATAELVQQDAASGAILRSIPLPTPPGVGAALVAGPGGSVWIVGAGMDDTRVTVVDAASGSVSTFGYPSNTIGGVVRAGNRMWAVEGPAAGAAGRLQELLPTGATSHVLPLPPGFDPDPPVQADARLWIPDEVGRQLVSFPLDALR